MLNEFLKYMIDKGYKELTPSGNKSTAYDYTKKVEKICKDENITISTLVNDINKYIKEYDIGGIKEEEGKKSNSAVINALKRFKEFFDACHETTVEEINDSATKMLQYIDKKIEFFNSELESIRSHLETLLEAPEALASEFGSETAYLNAKKYFLEYSVDSYNQLKKKLNAKVSYINNFESQDLNDLDLSSAILSCEAYINVLKKCVATHDERDLI